MWKCTPNWSQGELYPTTILRSRYGGVYEGANWVAFHETPSAVADTQGDDITCASFFRNYPHPIGWGNTPQEAYDKLKSACQKLTKED